MSSNHPPPHEQARVRLMVESLEDRALPSTGLDLSGVTAASGALAATIGSPHAVVAVIDTPVDYAPPELAANVWRNSGEVVHNGVDDGNGYLTDVHGCNFALSEGDDFDDDGHGTYVAGTISALGNNGQSVTEAAWNVRIMALRFLTSFCNGYLSETVRVFQFTVAQTGYAGSNDHRGGPSHCGQHPQAVNGFLMLPMDQHTTGGGIDTMFDPPSAPNRPMNVLVFQNFRNDLNDLYFTIIKPTVQRLGFRCFRVDELPGSNLIYDNVIQSINDADLIIFVVAGKLDNVMYEFALSEKAGKKLLLLLPDGEELPFYMGKRNALRYENNPAGGIRLEARLVEQVSALLSGQAKRWLAR